MSFEDSIFASSIPFLHHKNPDPTSEPNETILNLTKTSAGDVILTQTQPEVSDREILTENRPYFDQN